MHSSACSAPTASCTFAFATRCLRIYLMLILLTCVQKVCAIFLQSIGHARQAAPLSILRDALLILFSLIAPAMLGVTGIFWAAPIADVFAMAVTAVVMLKLWQGLSRQAPAPSACLPTDVSTKCAIRR